MRHTLYDAKPGDAVWMYIPFLHKNKPLKVIVGEQVASEYLMPVRKIDVEYRENGNFGNPTMFGLYDTISECELWFDTEYECQEYINRKAEEERSAEVKLIGKCYDDAGLYMHEHSVRDDNTDFRMGFVAALLWKERNQLPKPSPVHQNTWENLEDCMPEDKLHIIIPPLTHEFSEGHTGEILVRDYNGRISVNCRVVDMYGTWRWRDDITDVGLTHWMAIPGYSEYESVIKSRE